MMNKWRVKAAIFVFFTPFLVGGVLLFVNGLSQMLASFQQGADPASVFRGHALQLPSTEQARWLSTTPDDGTELSRAQQDEILSAYWLAWQAVNRAYQTGHTSDLSTYWALPALNLARESITPGLTFETTEHRLRVLLFSADESVIQLQDSFQFTQGSVTLQATATVTLTLDNGRWRIRLMTVDYVPVTESANT